MNKNIWNLYKTSERGKRAIELFTFKDEDDTEKKLIDIFEKYNEYLGGPKVKYNFLSICELVIDNIEYQQIFIEENQTNQSYFTRLIDTLEIKELQVDANNELVLTENEKPFIKQKDYKSLSAILSEISVILYIYGAAPYFPILFREQFDVFIKILDVLEIPLPDLPAKSDKRGRLLLYNGINNNIVKFAEENDLTSEETCACIYDFAQMLLEEEGYIEMPEPTNVWLTGGSKQDYENFLKEPAEGETSVWTCNENTKRGDIIVMYVLYPHSCLQSIWRADIDGVYTPFNYYNSRTRATDGILIPKITLKELKEDPYFSQLSITKKNFQGVNGVRLSANDYKELQKLLQHKGFDTTVLPKLYSPNLKLVKEIYNEKDVEEKLLIPLLFKLGYKEIDWTRQLSQKAGRKEKAIPDFVFLPKGEKHFQNAPLVIEAKFEFSSNIEKTKSYNQALSYARLMNASIFGICDKERLILFKKANGHFNRFKPDFEKYWEQINQPEIFSKLKLLIGKDNINQN